MNSCFRRGGVAARVGTRIRILTRDHTGMIKPLNIFICTALAETFLWTLTALECPFRGTRRYGVNNEISSEAAGGKSVDGERGASVTPRAVFRLEVKEIIYVTSMT